MVKCKFSHKTPFYDFDMESGKWERKNNNDKEVGGGGVKKKAPMLVQPASALKSASVPADWSRCSFELAGRRGGGGCGKPEPRPPGKGLMLKENFTPDLEADTLLTKVNWCTPR
ncbi:hypothetical protein TWF225_007409 [Orbilia oligospora]|nr:hypothetical protein TWF225_007409 [Orbilia oligospora]KAF3245723.1 hypothetical protein TWF217_010349 [Orbilia oligospora]